MQHLAGAGAGAVVVAVIVTVTAHKNDQLTEFLYPDSASDFCTADVANLNYNAEQTIY